MTSKEKRDDLIKRANRLQAAVPPFLWAHPQVKEALAIIKGMSEGGGCCAECAHWSSLVYQEKGSYGECVMMGSDDGRPAQQETKAFAVGRNSYGACTVTDPTFGCMMFERG